MQYFQRAVFEYHPENKGTPYEVLLAQLGTYRQRTRYQGLPLPPPRDPVFSQRAAQGSDRYLVWAEGSPGVFVNGTILRGFDMQTRQPLTLTNAPAEVHLSGLSGSLAVWEAGTVNCQSGPCAVTDTDIVGQDLATGQPFTVAAGPNRQMAPAIAGRTVVWLETTSLGQQVLAKDLDSTLVTSLATATAGSGDSFAPPAINDQYIIWVWQTVAPSTPRTVQIRIQAYNRASHDLRTVTEYTQPLSKPVLYALDGHRLVWLTAGGLLVADLNSGEQHMLLQPPLFANAPLVGALHLRGDLVFWVDTQSISGLRLSDGRALRPLAQGRIQQHVREVDPTTHRLLCPW